MSWLTAHSFSTLLDVTLELREGDDTVARSAVTKGELDADDVPDKRVFLTSALGVDSSRFFWALASRRTSLETGADFELVGRGLVPNIGILEGVDAMLHYNKHLAPGTHTKRN